MHQKTSVNQKITTKKAKYNKFLCNIDIDYWKGIDYNENVYSIYKGVYVN